MIVCEIAFAAAHTGDFAVPQHVPRELTRHWAELPGLLTLDLYTPVTDPIHDPYVDDGPAPRHLAMLAFASPVSLDRAVLDPAFAAGLSALGSAVSSCTAMQRSDHPVAEGASPAALAAPFSYVVRYHRPAVDEVRFVRHYVETHPPLLARLPGVRNVMCYVPYAWRGAAGLPSADYLLGNEVAFMHYEAFNAAMASPVRHELRAHYHTLPPYSGHNTHFAMHRRRLFG